MRISEQGRQKTKDDGRRTTADGRPSSVVHRFLPSVVRRLSSIVCLAPLLLFAARAAAGMLSVNPIQEALQISGRTALNLLILTLAVTPAIRLLHLPALAPLRRTLGLGAFGWALLHFAVFTAVDFGLNLTMIAREFTEKWYLAAGAAALAIMTPLAITSTRGWQRRLGARWKALHRAVFIGAAAALLHYWAALKPDLNDALLIYAPLLAALLLLRALQRRRRMRSSSPTKAPENNTAHSNPTTAASTTPIGPT